MLHVTSKNSNITWHVQNQNPIDYKIVETENVFDVNSDLLVSNGDSKRRLIIIDKKLKAIFADRIDRYFSHHGIHYEVIAIDADEENKNTETVLNLFKAFDNFRLKRRSEPVIAIGGGVLTDVVSFAASCYRRNVPCIRIPTTLMGYIDATIGIKTGINFSGNKNRVGTFCPPLLTILDRHLIANCPSRHISNGIGEIIKIAVIKDRKLFNILRAEIKSVIENRFQVEGREILQRAITGMMEELEPNLFEDNLERVVDFGHTFSTLIEMEDIENLLHGEAVAIDVCFSCALSNVKGLMPLAEVHRVYQLTLDADLPIDHHAITPEKMAESLAERSDHRDGYQRTPLPVSIGSARFFNDITLDDLEKAVVLHKNLVFHFNALDICNQVNELETA